MSGAAGSQPIPARIAWTARDRVYLASPDSLPLQVGDRITFRLRGDSVAAAEVTVVVAPEMAVARLTRGALLPHGDLQHVEILVEPPPLEPMYLLRVGLPGRARSNLIFACDPSLRPPAGYRVQGSSRRGLLLVRSSAAVAGPQRPWPDTLQVRLYDETADEEIAIERGDLDVAVFWPGELTARLRAPPRSLVTLGGGRSRGVVAAMRTDRGPARDSSAFVFPDRAAAALDGAVFRGDLERFPQAPPSADPRPEEPARFTVDPSFPGRRAIERVLDLTAPRAKGQEAAFRIFYLDAPVAEPDSIALAAARYVRAAFPPPLATRADSVAAALGAPPGASRRSSNPTPALDLLRDVLEVVPLFTLDCPVVCGVGAAPRVRAIGAGAFADLIDCGGRRP